MEEPQVIVIDGAKLTVYKDGTIVGPKGHPLKPAHNGRGYYYVVANHKRVGWHRLVAHVYLGVPLSGRNFWIHHKDGNALNNAADNLEIEEKLTGSDYSKVDCRNSKYRGETEWDKLREQLKDKDTEV